MQPLWWDAAWRIGWGQLILAVTVLAAAQLAAGRARRDGMAKLYASFPTTAATRTLAHLAGLVAVLPASLLLGGAITAAVQARDAIGTPDIATLAGGPLLVIAAGAAGVAIGVRFPHPLAGVLAAIVLLFSCVTSHLVSGAAIWLVPWEMEPDQVANLPSPLAGYPPSGPHAAELAGLAVVAGLLALVVTIRQPRARAVLAAAGIVAVAVTCFAGALQMRPIPTADLNDMITEIADPASVQHCTTASQVRYCLYPGFGSLLPSLEESAGTVIAQLPAQPGQPLTIRQVTSLSLPDSALTHGHSHQQASQWETQVQQAPGNANAAPTSSIYINSWPPAGQQSDAKFALALATADWALGLPGTRGTSGDTAELLGCAPVNQAREAVAIWLAILATHPPASTLQSGLGTGTSIQGTVVDNTFVRTWDYPGGYVTTAGGFVQHTAVGYLLAKQMSSVPQQEISDILAGAWGSWLNWNTTDAQLAAALGISMPSLPTGSLPPQAGTGPQAPLCTT
jgi:hypothetical protein